MKVKNKIISIVLLFAIFLITASLGIYFYFHNEVMQWGNDLKLAYDLSTNDFFKEKHAEINVTKYEINIDLFPKEKTIYCKTNIFGNISTDQEKIELDFYDNYKIHELLINGKATDYNFNDDEIEISRIDTNADSFNVSIVYEGSPQSLGFGSFEFGKEGKHKVIYTLNEPTFASTWFPCNDTPADKAEFKISITNDSNMVSVSNGILESVEKQQDRKTYTWISKNPISTYLIAIYSAPYQSFSQEYVNSKNDTMNIQYYILPEKIDEAKKAFSNHPEYLEVLSNLFGKYPFIDEKYGVAQIPWNYGAMESQTITGIGSRFISEAGFFSDVLIHEVAHHWWGNSVTPKSWRDIWLNEGFATYSEALYWEKTKGKSSLISTMESFKVSKNSETLYAPKTNLFSKQIYNKGAWVLHMLRREMGDSTFFSTLKQYHQKYKFSNADTYDFKNICEENSGLSLDQFFNQWVFEGEGIIDIEYDWEADNSESDAEGILIHIKQIQNNYESYQFPVDILIKENSGESFISSHFISSIDTILAIATYNEVLSIEFDPESWLLASFTQSE
ncbi:MAG: M1 family metallopeptidase [Bacteroidota bacterium]